MSQLPHPPLGLGPEDFAPIGVPQQRRQPQPGSLINGWAIASLVSGLLGFLPYAPGALAIVTGIVGLKKAGDPRYRGRSLAIGGIVLGSLSLVFWLFLAGTVTNLLGATQVQRQLAQDFLQMISTGAIDPAIERTASVIGRAEVERLARQVEPWGAYKELTSSSSSLGYDNGVSMCHLGGIATFADGEHAFTMTLIKEGDAWKVSALNFD